MTNVHQLHIQITTHLQTLKRELDRLSVRQVALTRCRKNAVSEKIAHASEEQDEAYEDIIANIDALEYDLATFRDQMSERLAHAERGLRLVSVFSDEKNASLLYQYMLDGVQLAVNDVVTARAGYDELIAELNEITHLRDV